MRLNELSRLMKWPGRMLVVLGLLTLGAVDLAHCADENGSPETPVPVLEQPAQPPAAEPVPAEDEDLAPVPSVDDADPVEPLQDVEEAPAAVRTKGKGGPEDAYKQIEMFTEVLLHIRRSYVEEKDYQELMAGALNGMLHALDPHSAFLEPKAYEDMKEDTSAQFSGIGIHIGMRDGLLTVIAPIEDTPAFRAGLQSGDRIIEVDGESTRGVNLADAVDKLRGEKGTSVTLTLLRPGEEESRRKVEIVRAVVEVPSIKGTRIIRDGIGYLRITQFAFPTAASLQEELDKLQAMGMTALVLDLRNNPGGLLRTAVQVAEKFLEWDALIVTTRGRRGVSDEVTARAAGNVRLVGFPMAILVNRGSASASEIVAGALKDNKRAILVGETTFGKGSVQSVIRLKPDGASAIRLTTAYYYTPSGSLIHEKGIDPDILVYVEPAEWRRVQVRRAHAESPDLFTDAEKAEYADVIDLQLQRAVDLLQAIQIFKSNN